MEADLEPERFWKLTVAEAEREMRAASSRQSRRADENIWLAWHIVALDRTNKLPTLESLLRSKQDETRKQSADEMLVAMKSIYLAFGGDPGKMSTDQ